MPPAMLIPQNELDMLKPAVRELFLYWDAFLRNRVKFNMSDSEIHAEPHCKRVLLYALILGEEIFDDDNMAMTALAHAAVFHDTRRLDDYLDTGHGARAAVYYRQFCEENRDISFMSETALMMKYHDIDDRRGKLGIEREYKGSLPKMFKLYDIFKDADALDRWRLGDGGLDAKFLRTEQAKRMTGYSRRIVLLTMSNTLRSSIARRVEESMRPITHSTDDDLIKPL